MPNVGSVAIVRFPGNGQPVVARGTHTLRNGLRSPLNKCGFAQSDTAWFPLGSTL